MRRHWAGTALLIFALMAAACTANGPIVRSSPAGAASPQSTPSNSTVARCTAVTLFSPSGTQVTAGELVIVDATAAGCYRAEYRFWIVSGSTGVGLVMQDWSPASSWSWDTTDEPVDEYSIKVDARAFGEAPDTGTGSNVVDVSGVWQIAVVHTGVASGVRTVRCTGVSVTASPQPPVAAGTAVTATATPHGCAQAEFRFQLVDLSTGVGLVMQDWGPSGTWTWDTSGSQAGRYAIRVDARAYGVASQDPDATNQVEVDVVHLPPSGSPVAGRCSSVTVSESPASPVTAGARVTATAVASGCGAAEFRFELVDLSNGVGLVMQDWSASSTWTWDTTGQRAGRFAIRVDVRAYGVASDKPDATNQVEVDVAQGAPP